MPTKTPAKATATAAAPSKSATARKVGTRESRARAAEPQKNGAPKNGIPKNGTQTAAARNGQAQRAPAKKRWRSRAVTRTVDAGNSAYCAVCDELIKFRARVRAEQIICNVYVKNRWDRVEHYHPECYRKAGKPYGDPAG